MASSFNELCSIDISSAPDACLDPLLSLPPVPSPSSLLERALSSHPRLSHFCHVNACSLPSHIDEMTFLFENRLPVGISVVETWLSPSLPDALVRLPGYNLVRTDRQGKRGGGVALYLRDDLKYKIIASAGQCGRPEFLFVETKISCQQVLIGVIYKPPNVGYLNDIEDIIFQLAPIYTDIIIMGDWNINVLKNSPDVRHMREILSLTNLELLPLLPTHHLPDSSSQIDHIIVSKRHKAASFGQIPVVEISKHDLIYVSYSLKAPKYQPFSLTFRNFKRCNVDNLKAAALQLPWDQIDSLAHIDDKLAQFNQLTLGIFDIYAPLKTVRITRPKAPWLTPHIQGLRKIRDASFSVYKQDNTSTNFERYKYFRNKVKQQIRNSKLKFFYNLSSSLNTKKTWKVLKASGIGKQSASHVVGHDLNLLNTIFAATQTPNMVAVRQTISEIFSQPRPPVPVFSFRQVSSNEVLKAANRIKSKAVGSDGISIQMFSLISQASLPALTSIINQSIRDSIFPSLWKNAHIRPLPKKSKPTCPSDFRPISILPALSKCLEYIALDQLESHFRDNKLHDSCQSGFRSNHSTCTALLRIADDCRYAMDRQQLTIIVLLDFSLAFNSINFDILGAKLQHFYNLAPSATAWIQSYLNGRQQRVLGDESMMSDSILLRNGTPQGSVLAPKIFQSAISDIGKCFLSCKYHCYADDIQTYFHFNISETDNAFLKINDDLARVLEWSEKNLLKLNPVKCQAVVIGTQSMLERFRSRPHPDIRLGESIIPLSPSVKNLGVMFDSKLSWSDQVSAVCKKVFGSLHSLHRLKNFLPQKLKIRLVQSLIFPHFDYCDSLYSSLSVHLQGRLQRAQNCCLRFCCNTPYRERVTPVYLSISWLKLDGRRSLHQATLIYKILHNSAPEYLSCDFIPLSNRNARRDDLLSIPRHTTQIYHNSFLITSINLWNSIPRDIRSSPSISIFKARFRRYLQSRLQ